MVNPFSLAAAPRLAPRRNNVTCHRGLDIDTIAARAVIWILIVEVVA
jgi:hypothetical protein